MFNIPEAMRSYWDSKTYEKATPDGIARIESIFGRPLPASYIDFMNRFGFVVFDDVPGMLSHFDYTVVPSEENKFATEGEVGQGNIAFFFKPDKIVRAYGNLTEPDCEDDEYLPKFPRHYLPIANDAGQGIILMEIAEKPGRIWYWSENDWAWGLEDNTWLGFVADDFEGFINGLKP